MNVCGNSLFGSGFNYIKVGNGEFVAVEGSNTAERLILSELRIPYTQILKSKITIKKSQENYFLNYLGLGDNVTFLAIKAIFDTKSVIEEDNYLIWSYFDGSRRNKMGTLMVLTGNSTNRIPQIFISNPNTKYDVQLEIMIAVIDSEESEFFIAGNYPFFATSQDIEEMRLIGTITPELQFIEFELATEPNDSDENTGFKKQKFEVPANFTITGIQQFDSQFNSWQWLGGDKEESIISFNENWDNEVIMKEVTPGQNVNYIRYAHKGPKVGSRKLRLWRI
jgi:hypothetical protein